MLSWLFLFNLPVAITYELLFHLAVMQTTKQVMEQGLADGIYIDYWQEEDKFQCIKTSIINEICDQVWELSVSKCLGNSAGNLSSKNSY